MYKILIVEDELSIAELERDYLNKSGYEVDICTNGDDGLKKATEGRYDLYVLDVMLPGTDGLTICSAIRKEKHVPIIIVSARKDDADKIKGLELGADDYMTKPFSPSELVARVNSHMSRYNELTGMIKEEAETVEINGLKIDKTNRAVWVNGEEKAFTAKEYQLLLFLAEHPNHVYTKNELFEEIWAMESFGEIANVTVHIKKIREKLGDTTENPKYIETIWGVGYRFKA